MASDLPFPVDLLEEIFVFLDDAADLVRVSATCTSFRRVVSDGRFLRGVRSLHRRRRPALGLLLDVPSRCETEFVPAQPPRRSAQAAAGFANAADFTFSFLTGRKRWRHVCDVRDGRVLLAWGPRRHDNSKSEGYVVYDPLHRRHVQIPAIPHHMLLAEHGIREILTFDDPFLAPPAAEDLRDDDDDDVRSVRFRVMCTAQSAFQEVAFVFSSASGQWRYAASFRSEHPHYVHTNRPWLWHRQYVHGCVCWVHEVNSLMIMFDTREMNFSIVDLPSKSSHLNNKLPVEAEDGRLGLLLLSVSHPFSCHGPAMIDMYSKARQGIQEPEEWRHDRSISILPGFRLVSLAGAAEGYVLLRGIPPDQLKLRYQTYKSDEHYFTLELKTLIVETLCVLECNKCIGSKFLYASFPPPLSLPSV